jgi:AcrR family transcriptional regulator
MTDKKENILNTALELFAKDGFNAVSTSKIARAAGVSEGLIFRHFENKKGLLDAIVKDAEKRIQQVFAPVLFETDPKKVIALFIELPFDMRINKKEELDFWKLQFKLKWESDYNNPDKMKPVLEKLIWAFTELGYQNPGFEAGMLSQLLDSVSIGFLRDGTEPDEQYQTFLKNKYNV